MQGLILLTWRYLASHRWRSLILVLCLALTFLLPIYLRMMISRYQASLISRAASTPLILGAKGNSFELALRHLYFSRPDAAGSWISQANLLDAEKHGQKCLILPMHVGYTAQRFAVVGTALEYFGFRGLRPTVGRLPQRLGECVLGAEVAEKLALSPGAFLLTDQTSLYNIAAEQPLKMRVAGVLAASGTPDDRAVFVDVKTAWVIAGLGHGHEDLADPKNQGRVMGRDAEGAVVANASVTSYREVTEENLASFHFHGTPEHLPLSALIVLPESAKAATLFKGQYSLSKTLQVITPAEVVSDLLGIVLKVKRFFDANQALILTATALFLLLIVSLTLRLRARERETLHRIGCARLTVFYLQALELLFLLLSAFALALALAYALARFTQHWFPT